MAPRVLYCGDTSLTGAAAYLAGLMTSWHWDFDYVPSNQGLVPEGLAHEYDLFIFSDYPASRLSSDLATSLRDRVAAGAGLLMIGGWESFHGLGGDWDQSPLAAALPVEIGTADDRVNSDEAFYATVVSEAHPIVAGLPWRERPPLVGGFNRIVPKAGALTVLELTRLRVRRETTGFSTKFGESSPLLITGEYGMGRTAAFASDVAPHWIGPMVDWGPGPQRVTGQAPGAEAIEVGAAYAQFFRQLLTWCRGTH